MDNRETYMWDVSRSGVDSMEYEEDKRSEGEIYSDVDSMDGYARERRAREKMAAERESDNRKSDKDRDKERDGERERSSRRDRSRDHDRHGKGRSSRRSSERRRSRSRDSSRGRHDRKSRSHKHKGRHRRHSSSDSRSSSRSGGHSRRRRSRSRSRSFDSYGSSADSRDYYSDYYNERGEKSDRDSYKYQEPNSTVMVRGLAPNLTEQDIRAEILKSGVMAKDIRLIRHRETGASRGFAFVEFHSVQDAVRWMEMKQGTLTLRDEYQADLIYSIPKASFSEKSRAALSDWFCTKCQGHNFKRREFCYKCHNPRPDEQDPELTEELSSHPTNTIILHNLDALTTEEGVLQAFKGRPSLASIPIRSVRIARESVTNLSRGMCYVETNNVGDAVRLYSILTHDAFTVDSRQVGVAYCKTAQHGTAVSNVAATALAAAQWTNSGNPSNYDEETIEKMAQYSAGLYAKNPAEHTSYLSYYRNYYRNQKAQNDSSKQGPSSSGTESAVASAAASVVKASSGSSMPSQGKDKKDGQTTASSYVPDTSGYQYDENSGYYYDPVTGYYYDANTQYFYDSLKQQYLYWSPEQNKYVPVSDASSSTSQGTEESKIVTEKKKDKEKKVEKTDKVKVAKKIAKDMEKWAKTLNQKKEGIRPVISSESSTNGSASVSAPEAEPYAPGEAQLFKRIDVGSKPVIGTSVKPTKALLATSYREVESDSEDETLKRNVSGVPTSEPTPESLVDFNKLACLLCKRQFPNKDVLIKHTKLSDLHKKNLEELKNSSSSGSKSFYGESSTGYRDRAKERRMKVGSDPIEGRSTLKDLYMKAKIESSNTYDEPTREGIKDDNLGNRMLQKMGWQEGQGLGKVNQGRTEIITTHRRAANAGLGLRSIPVVDEEDDRYTRARKLTLARYQELE